MAKKEDKKAKKPAKTPVKEVRKQTKASPKTETTTIKKSDVSSSEKRETKVIKKPEKKHKTTQNPSNSFIDKPAQISENIQWISMGIFCFPYAKNKTLTKQKGTPEDPGETAQTNRNPVTCGLPVRYLFRHMAFPE